MQQIKSDGVPEVCGIEIHHVIGSPGRNQVQDFFNQITMRIDQTNTTPRFDILNDHVSKQCCFPGARLADQIDMVPSIFRLNPEEFVTPIESSAEDQAVTWHTS